MAMAIVYFIPHALIFKKTGAIWFFIWMICFLKDMKMKLRDKKLKWGILKVTKKWHFWEDFVLKGLRGGNWKNIWWQKIFVRGTSEIVRGIWIFVKNFNETKKWHFFMSLCRSRPGVGLSEVYWKILGHRDFEKFLSDNESYIGNWEGHWKKIESYIGIEKESYWKRFERLYWKIESYIEILWGHWKTKIEGYIENFVRGIWKENWELYRKLRARVITGFERLYSNLRVTLKFCDWHWKKKLKVIWEIERKGYSVDFSEGK